MSILSLVFLDLTNFVILSLEQATQPFLHFLIPVCFLWFEPSASFALTSRLLRFECCWYATIGGSGKISLNLTDMKHVFKIFICTFLNSIFDLTGNLGGFGGGQSGGFGGQGQGQGFSGNNLSGGYGTGSGLAGNGRPGLKPGFCDQS